MDQLFFKLEPNRPFGLEYFVPHSGVLDALSLGRALVDRVASGRQFFAQFVVRGPKGSGKTHLLAGLRHYAEREGVDPSSIDIVDLAQMKEVLSDQEVVSRFVAIYDQRRAKNGILLVEWAELSLDPELDRHVRSRLLAGANAELEFPREVELDLIVRSLVERRNLKLPDTAVSYLLRHLPGDPLTFDRILTAVDEQALSSRRSVGRKLIGEVVRSA